MEMRSSKTPPAGEKTPNCVSCSRSVEHIVCTVLHLLGTDWRIEETLPGVMSGVVGAKSDSTNLTMPSSGCADLNPTVHSQQDLA